MAWIDQTIVLNNETLNRLHRISMILGKGHYAHQSLKLIYIVIALLSAIAILVVVEFMFFNRRVSSGTKYEFDRFCVFFNRLASNERENVSIKE